MSDVEIGITVTGIVVAGLVTFLSTAITILFGILVWQMKSLTSSVQILNEKVAAIITNTERHDSDIQLIFRYIKEMQSNKNSDSVS